MFSTSGGVQYIGDIMSTLEGCSVHWRDVQYIGGIPSVHWGCSVHRRDTMSTSGGYHEYIGGFQYIGGYHDTCGGIP